VREYQEAATAIPRSLPPLAPSEGLRTRVLEAAAGRQAPRRALFSRVFWAAAAIFLFALLLNSLTRAPWKAIQAKGTKDAPSAQGDLRWNEASVKLYVTGLPALPAGKVYQLWHIGPAAAPLPRKTFTLNAGGTLAGSDTMDHAIVKGHKFALTIEPSGGSKSPTMPIYWVVSAE
jgi:anti-sigma-K factor RskA